jgi:predicted pyridoxine 5'-phosphate oxidase superfamily flavin-nucleotide-binding protein
MPRIPSSTAQSRSGASDLLGERALQKKYGTTARAGAFYSNQMLDHLNEAMESFLGRMDLVFISTADAQGDCDASFRAGPTGFMQVLNDKTLAYPEYRGNGVMASLGNIRENPKIGLLFLDFYRDKIGLHINGRASVISPQAFKDRPDSPIVADEHRPLGNPRVEFWVVIDVEEAYIHCSKHIPLLRKLTSQESVAWGTDDAVAKGGDYFKAAAARRAANKDKLRGNPDMRPEELVCAVPAPIRKSRRSA